MIDVLERRRLLSAAVVNKVLTITGTSGVDAYDVRVVNDRVQVTENGAVQTFGGVRSISASLGGGNDTFAIDSTILVAATIVGGAGNDSLQGGAGPDVISGNDGNDTLRGGAGTDALIGGLNNDLLDGQAGDDYLDGQGGADTVSYETRTSPVTAHIDINYIVADSTGVDPSLYTTYAGGGGESGEADTYRSVETLLGGTGDDQLRVQLGGDLSQDSSLYPGSKLNIASVDGRSGNDSLLAIGELSEDTSSNTLYQLFLPTLQGGTGNDSFGFTGHSKARMLGNEGNDTFSFNSDDSSIDTVDGGAGTDDQDITLQTGSGPMLSQMGNGVENAQLNSIAITTFHGNSLSNNIVIRQADTLTVFAGAGNDRIELDTTFSDSAVTIFGESGNDAMIDNSTGETDDTFDGGTGGDTVSYQNRTTSITGSIAVARSWNSTTSAMQTVFTGLGGAAAEGDTYTSVETLVGGQGDDTLSASVSFQTSAQGPTTAADLGIAYGFLLDGSAGKDAITLQGLTSKSGLRASEIALMRPTLRGSAGDDALMPIGFSAATWQGGDGNDTLEPTSDTSYLYADGGAGTDTMEIGAVTGYAINTIDPNFENANLASSYVTTFYGNALNNKITVNATTPITIRGQAGDDTIDIVETASVGTVYGGDGNDTIDAAGSTFATREYGEAGNDVMLGGDRVNDTMDGGLGDDALFGRSGNDSMVGGDGNDYFEGGKGNDILLGQAGNDRIRGNAGVDSVDGGIGDDTFYVRDADLDSVYGGTGTDSIQRDASEAVVNSCEKTLA